MSAAAIRAKIVRGVERAKARTLEALGVYAKRQRSLKKRGLAGFSPPTPVKWEKVTTYEGGRLSVTLTIMGLRLISELNRREHHMATHKRKKSQQEIVHWAFQDTGFAESVASLGLPILITVTRVAPGRITDGDNATSCAKHTRDQVAREIGIDDGDHRLAWEVEQERAGRGVYGCRITVERLPSEWAVES